MERKIAEMKLVHGQVLRLLQEELWVEEAMKEQLGSCREKEGPNYLRSHFGGYATVVRSSPLGNRF